MDETIRALMNKLKLALLLIFAVSNLEMTVIAASAEPDTAGITSAAANPGSENAPIQRTTATTTEVTTVTTKTVAHAKICKPAVSHINGWLSGGTDYLHNQRVNELGAFGEGGIAMPLGYIFGTQLHALGSTNFQSGDAYAFWREPTQGLFGPHVMYTKSGDFHSTLYGLHGEVYSDNFTLRGEAGGTAIRNGHHSNNIYYEAILDWYAKPDWKFYIGGIVMGDGAVQIGTEYLFSSSRLPNFALFADAGMGGHSLNYGFLGIRYYISPCHRCKSLMLRHREDMVPSTLNIISRVDD